MITDYMEDLEIENPFNHLKPWERTPYEKVMGRNIYKNGSGKYYIEKVIDKEKRRWGVYDTFQEALEVRDELIRNDWVKVLSLEERQKEYYRNVYLHGNKYMVGKGDFRAYVSTIEEAMYYRDICKRHEWQDMPVPSEPGLLDDNPYLIDGLDYPIPERLAPPPAKPKDKGYISKHGNQSYIVMMNANYYGSYRTYEMAYYVRQELNKRGWNKDNLPDIIDDYPVWYTWLMNLYQYIAPQGNGYILSITPLHSDDGKLQHLYFSRLEDALWERDLLVKHDWDEELVVECADDSMNPYYDMELPPYPQRKIKRIKEREPRTELFNRIYDLINESDNHNIQHISSLVGITEVGLRIILKKEYDIDWKGFRALCENGINPNDVLEQKPLIYKPNLDIINDNNYVSYYKDCKTPYIVSHKNEDRVTIYYGAYPTRELANKISDDLQKCGWDKSRLKEIQARHGWQSTIGSRRWVYPRYYRSKRTGERRIQDYQIYRKVRGRKTYYGCYRDKRVAELVRDLLVEHDWCKERVDEFKDYAMYCIRIVDEWSV